MKYFYIFILTLILISCNEKKGYGEVIVEYDNLNVIEVEDMKECRKAVEKGKILSTITYNDVEPTYETKILQYEDYVYVVGFKMFQHKCKNKRKYVKESMIISLPKD